MSHFLFRNGSGGGNSDITIIDNLESNSITDALSANQGRALKELIDNHEKLTVFSEEGVHGFRYYKGNLQYLDGEEWKDILEEDKREGFTLLHRDTYISNEGQVTFDITLPNYNTEQPIIVSRNGIVLPPTDYTITGNQVTLNRVSANNLVQLLVLYNTDPEISSSLEEKRDVYIAEQGQNTFTITNDKYTSETPILVSRNGLILLPSDYTINGNTVTLNTVSQGALVQLLTWNKLEAVVDTPLKLNRDIYMDTANKTDFAINTIGYYPTFPTIVTRSGLVIQPSDYTIVKENGSYLVRLNESRTSNSPIQILVLEGLIGDTSTVLSVNGRIGHVVLTNDDVNAPSKEEFEEVKNASKILISDTPPTDTSFIWGDTTE